MLLVTVLLVTVTLALLAPAGIVTLAGTVAAAVLLLESVTTAPPDGAALVRVTVACEVFPPITIEGLKAIVESEAGGGVPLVTVRVADRLALPTNAVIVTKVFVVTAEVLI